MWSPDGATIAFKSQGDDGVSQVFVVDVSPGSTPVALTTDENTLGSNEDPVWSPDGATIAFMGEDATNIPQVFTAQVFTVPANGSGVPQALTTAENAHGNNLLPLWSFDGRQIVFTNLTGEQREQVFVVAAGGGVPISLTAGRPRGSNVFPAWSTDRSRIAFTNRADIVDQIFVMDADGSNPRALTNDQASPGNNSDPAWSPDGLRIAFTNGAQIHVLDVDTGQRPMALTNANDLPGDNTQAAWSPDGERVAFTNDLSAGRQVYVIDADGRTPAQPLTEDSGDTEGENYNPDWSPGGSQITFVNNNRRRGGERVLVMDDDRSNPRALTNAQETPGDIVGPVWSPDGKLIAFINLGQNESRVFVTDSDGSGVPRAIGPQILAGRSDLSSLSWESLPLRPVPPAPLNPPVFPPVPMSAPGAFAPQSAPAPAALGGGVGPVAVGGGVVSGEARLLGVPRKCVRGGFSVRVEGRQLRRVTFFVGRKRVKRVSVRARATSQRARARINTGKLRSGRHALRVRVEFAPQSGTAAKTLRARFRRC